MCGCAVNEDDHHVKDCTRTRSQCNHSGSTSAGRSRCHSTWCLRGSTPFPKMTRSRKSQSHSIAHRWSRSSCSTACCSRKQSAGRTRSRGCRSTILQPRARRQATHSPQKRLCSTGSRRDRCKHRWCYCCSNRPDTTRIDAPIPPSTSRCPRGATAVRGHARGMGGVERQGDTRRNGDDGSPAGQSSHLFWTIVNART